MVSEKIACALGLIANQARKTGATFDNETIYKQLKTTHNKAVFANAEGNYRRAAAKEALLGMDFNSPTGRLISAAEKFGIPAHDIVGFLGDPETFLGKGVVDRVNSVYMNFLASSDKSLEAWRSTGKKQIKQIQEEALSTIKPINRDLAEKYFKKHLDGGQLFGLHSSTNPLSTLARNAVGNLVSWNPMITLMNAFEFTPKALAYSAENGNPAALLKGLSTAFQKSGGNIFQRVPELEQMGVYGFNEHGKGLFGLNNLLDVTENPLRTFSYYVGESIAPGKGLEALEKIAFVNRLGNEPLIYLDHTGTDTLALMRYSLSASKMYLRLLNGIKSGDVNSGIALAAFSAMTALQSGGASAIPAPIYGLLPDDYKQGISEFDDATGLNLAKHLTGSDYTQQQQPLGLPVLGAGLSIATQDVKGAFTSLGKASAAASEGDLTNAAAQILDSAFGFGQLARIPGVNLTSKRVIDEMAKVAAGEAELSFDSAGVDLLEKTKLLNEPKY